MRGGLFLIAPLIAVLAFAACESEEQAQPSPSPTASPTPASAVETLAFIRDGDVWLIGVDGTGERRLNLTDVQSFVWVSPAELDVVAGGEPPRHLLVDLEGNAPALPFPAGGSWSRDGSLYVVPVNREIVVFRRDGGEVARLRAGPATPENPDKAAGDCPLVDGEPDRLAFGQPVLSPDGQSVLVAVNCASRAGATGNLEAPVYEAFLDGTVNRAMPELSTNLREVTSPRFSPDGAFIAQTGVGQSGPCLYERALSLTAADGSGRMFLTPAALAELQQQEPRPELRGGVVGYDWSPDGDAIAASFDVTICETGGRPAAQPVLAGLYRLKLDGSPDEKLVDGQAHSPAWSPSGRYVAFVVGPFFGAPSEGGTIRLLDLASRQTADLAAGSQPAWQPQP